MPTTNLLDSLLPPPAARKSALSSLDVAPPRREDQASESRSFRQTLDRAKDRQSDKPAGKPAAKTTKSSAAKAKKVVKPQDRKSDRVEIEGGVEEAKSRNRQGQAAGQTDDEGVDAASAEVDATGGGKKNDDSQAVKPEGEATADMQAVAGASIAANAPAQSHDAPNTPTAAAAQPEEVVTLKHSAKASVPAEPVVESKGTHQPETKDAIAGQSEASTGDASPGVRPAGRGNRFSTSVGLTQAKVIAPDRGTQAGDGSAPVSGTSASGSSDSLSSFQQLLNQLLPVAGGEAASAVPRAVGEAHGDGISDSSMLNFSATGFSPAGERAATNGTAKVAAATPPQLDFAEVNHPKIISDIRSQLLPGGGSMQIRLDPPELGTVQVTVHMRDGVMTATFETSNEQATQALSHSLHQLKNTLEAAGVNVEKLHVQQSSRQDSHGKDPGGDSQKQTTPQEQHQARQEQQRRELMQRMWRKLNGTGDPLDLLG